MKKESFPFEEKFLLYQQNVFPAMIGCLAEDLGVKVESVKKLGVGFLPGEQAWIFAERDAKGHIIGLLRRYENGKKFIIEGGKRGLIYEAQGTKVKGEIVRQNKFIRVADANVCCPICGKPDWCMVSDDNPKNPASVICPRVSEGATKSIEGAGYLHHRTKTTIRKSGHSILPDSSKPILVVEGASDVLVATDMEYVAVGKPKADGGNDLLVKLLKGKKVIIIGENDPEYTKNGLPHRIGQRGMETTFQILKPICPSVVKILPPDEFKDLREWHPTASQFDQWVRHNAIKELDSKFFETKHPRPLAINWLEKTQTKNGRRFLHFHCPRKKWYQYNNSYYQELPPEPLEEELYKYFTGREALIRTKFGEEFQPLNVNEYFIRNIKHALSRACLIDQFNELQEPFYIRGKKQIDITRAVVFRNGIYHVLDDRLEPLSPNIFITSTLPFDYNPNARCDYFKGTVEDDFNGDQECIDLLQEWFGYNEIASNFMQQMMFFYGRPGSGKTTIVNTLRAMLGADRCCAINIENLSDRFGLQSAIGKYSIIISEDRTTRKMDAAKTLQRIKRITGGDWMPVEEKFKDLRQVKPIWRITYDGNEMLSELIFFIFQILILKILIEIWKTNSPEKHRELQFGD